VVCIDEFGSNMGEFKREGRGVGGDSGRYGEGGDSVGKSGWSDVEIFCLSFLATRWDDGLDYGNRMLPWTRARIVSTLHMFFGVERLLIAVLNCAFWN
jgi:hypothetical protein